MKRKSGRPFVLILVQPLRSPYDEEYLIFSFVNYKVIEYLLDFTYFLLGLLDLVNISAKFL